MAFLAVLWLVSWWMYRQKIFVNLRRAKRSEATIMLWAFKEVAMGRFALLLGIVGLVTGADARPKDAVQKEWKQLQGVWKMISLEQDGQQDPGGVLGKLEPWTFKAGQATMYEVPENGVVGSCTVRAADGRQEIDIKVEGRLVRGIYETDGNSLRLCVSYPESGHRPTKFMAKQDSKQVYYVFKRVKP